MQPSFLHVLDLTKSMTLAHGAHYECRLMDSEGSTGGLSLNFYLSLYVWVLKVKQILRGTMYLICLCVSLGRKDRSSTRGVMCVMLQWESFLFLRPGSE